MPPASESHASRIATQTQTQKQKQGIPFSAENGAPRLSEDELRRQAQAAVVAAYAKAARESFQPIVGRARQMIAGQAGILLDDGWKVEQILRAVDRFARRRRYAGHLAQWCRENAMDEREGKHEQHKKNDPRDGGLKSIFAAMKEAGL